MYCATRPNIFCYPVGIVDKLSHESRSTPIRLDDWIWTSIPKSLIHLLDKFMYIISPQLHLQKANLRLIHNMYLIFLNSNYAPTKKIYITFESRPIIRPKKICDPVVIKSICCRSRAIRLNGWKKIGRAIHLVNWIIWILQTAYVHVLHKCLH